MTNLFTTAAIKKNPELSFLQDNTTLSNEEKMYELYHLFMEENENTDHLVFFLLFLTFMDREETDPENRDILQDVSNMFKKKIQIKIKNILLVNIINLMFGKEKMEQFKEWVDQRK